VTAVDRVSIFLVAQNRLLRESLARILKKSDISVVGACVFSPTLLDQITALAPDVLVIDSFSLEVPHLHLIRGVQRALPGTRVVMIGMNAEEQKFLQAVREGVAGYVLGDAPSSEIIGAVLAVAHGQGVCPPELCLCLFRQIARGWNEVPNYKVRSKLGLTNREQELVFLVGRGLSNKQIASQLQLAEQTVRNHVHHMLRKLGAPHRLAAVDLCRNAGLPV
jgi:two-component system, NarL family, response regulator DevR